MDSNGGVRLPTQDCDDILEAVMSAETAQHIIANAPDNTLTGPIGLRIVDGSFRIRPFKNGDGETKIFILEALDLASKTEPTFEHEKKYFVIPE